MSSWESRMAERARQRADRLAAQARLRDDEAARAAYGENAQRPWLNGWPRDSTTSVRIGTGINCVCCGRLMGVVGTVFPPDWESPGPVPLWPFTEADCPLCAGLGDLHQYPDPCPDDWDTDDD